MAEGTYKLPGDGFNINRFPMVARGFFRRYRNLSQWLLIGVFIILPWVQINGLPAILINLPDRRFTFFGLRFWGHDAPLLFFVLASFSLSLLFVTSVWGRVWCGWVCPQTIVIDGIFRRIEVLIEGNYIARKKLHQKPFDKEKIIKEFAKWFLFCAVSSVLSHTFYAYFIGPGKLASMALSSPVNNLPIFLIVQTTSIIILLNFAWFKERLCTIICPYGRLQSVLMDEDSLVVAYDVNRGEPRKGSTSGRKEAGDCINCFKCVAVCPTGIDIRNGIQMECIACTSCIDACDDVMRITKKPKGLIRYESENGLSGEKTSFWKIKNYVYLGLTLLSISGIFLFVLNRSALDITVLRAHENPYQVIRSSNGETLIVNHFALSLKNQSSQSMEVEIIKSGRIGEFTLEIIAPTFPLVIPTGEAVKDFFFIKFPKSVLDKKGHENFKLQITVTSKNITQKYTKEISLVGPI
ncbi:MAG: cytochrome c oxidase accessory protein CcoG [Candidatus Brocadiaceae bacterium]|nr:cytochrome c oxidase accessory protein CcoG [Candidatus Brocadiaceae bacterium]